MEHPKNALPTIREFDGHDWFSTKINKRNLPHWELKGTIITADAMNTQKAKAKKAIDNEADYVLPLTGVWTNFTR